MNKSAAAVFFLENSQKSIFLTQEAGYRRSRRRLKNGVFLLPTSVTFDGIVWGAIPCKITQISNEISCYSNR